MAEVVLYERRGPAAWVTLNRPDKLNAISGEVVTRLRECWKQAIEDDEVKVVVLTGAGRAFSAGYDISEEVEQNIVGAESWHDVLAQDVALTMELWRIVQRSTRGFWRVFLLPGLALQRLTTREPRADETQVALRAVAAVLRRELA